MSSATRDDDASPIWAILHAASASSRDHDRCIDDGRTPLSAPTPRAPHASLPARVHLAFGRANAVPAAFDRGGGTASTSTSSSSSNGSSCSSARSRNSNCDTSCADDTSGSSSGDASVVSLRCSGAHRTERIAIADGSGDELVDDTILNCDKSFKPAVAYLLMARIRAAALTAPAALSLVDPSRYDAIAACAPVEFLRCFDRRDAHDRAVASVAFGRQLRCALQRAAASSVLPLLLQPLLLNDSHWTLLVVLFLPHSNGAENDRVLDAGGANPSSYADHRSQQAPQSQSPSPRPFRVWTIGTNQQAANVELAQIQRDLFAYFGPELADALARDFGGVFSAADVNHVQMLQHGNMGCGFATFESARRILARASYLLSRHQEHQPDHRRGTDECRASASSVATCAPVSSVLSFHASASSASAALAAELDALTFQPGDRRMAAAGWACMAAAPDDHADAGCFETVMLRSKATYRVLRAQIDAGRAAVFTADMVECVSAPAVSDSSHSASPADESLSSLSPDSALSLPPQPVPEPALYSSSEPSSSFASPHTRFVGWQVLDIGAHSELAAFTDRSVRYDLAVESARRAELFLDVSAGQRLARELGEAVRRDGRVLSV